MAFILEDLTDEQREQMGFAKTMDDVKLANGRRCSFVSHWTIDRERDAYFIPTGVNDYELHWKNDVILIKTSCKETLWDEPHDKSNIRKYDHSYTIKEIVAPQVLEEKISTIKTLIEGSIRSYWNGGLKYKGNIDVNFLPNTEIRFPINNKSKVKLIDFETVQ